MTMKDARDKHSMFCVCIDCSDAVARGHRDGDERFGRNWLAGDGCGCAACRSLRARLEIDAAFARVTKAEEDLARFRRFREALARDREAGEARRG
jgi:hypothetical protein